MHYRIRHRTEYSYTSPIMVAHNLARLTPVNLAGQKCRHNVLRIEPQPDVQQQHFDLFGNVVTFFGLEQPCSRMVVEALSEVEVAEPNWPYAGGTPGWQATRELLRAHDTPDTLQAFQFTLESPFVPRTPGVLAYAQASFAQEAPVLAAAMALVDRIYTEFTYAPQSTTISTSLDQLLAQRAGVCQDFTHLAIACLRGVGLAARYVSGYLRTLPRPGEARLVGIDHSHAWFQLFVPEYGWVDLDPTNNLLCGLDHIRVAVGRDYGDITPLRGVVIGGGSQMMQVAVDVEPIEAPGIG